MNREEPLEIEDSRLELENRIRNLLWTVSGDYKLDMKPDISLFLRSRAIALYDGIKQGALARFYDKDLLGLYLVKKVFLQAGEGELTAVAQLCIEEAIGEKICEERPGIRSMQREAFEDILDQEFEEMPSQKDLLGRLKVAVLRRRLDGGEYRVERRMVPFMELVIRAGKAKDTMELIRVIDELYNALVDPMFERLHGNLERVLAVTLEELTEYSWEDFLSEEMYEEALESYVEQLTTNMAGMEDRSVTEEMEEKRHKKKNITVVTPEMLEKAYTYVELNYGKTYLSEAEEKRINYLMCRGVHSDCSLYFTEGILKNPAKRNYQYEYAKRLRNKNIWLYHDKHRIVKRNISVLTDTLRKSLVLRSETQTVLSDRGQIVPSRLWRIGRSRDAKFFEQELKGEASEFVVDVLIDASGSQMSRQGEVALQAYIISEALSNVEIPHRVMSFCTFWDYTILHRFREYDDPRTANENIFNYVTSSNNRDGLAIKTAGYGLLAREEEKKILIVLSDGKPYDVLVNRPNARNPKPYQGQEAISDTATEIRHLRNLEVSVLGVFAGEEKDLATEKKIFGKDFAYIRDIKNFSKIVGRYLTKQLEIDG
ncbi:cobaltochelatase CobT-related protein [Blautia obeum]|uniref:cobaltochelatase CobT-related protein n=1 Tax=Blautia obeum TaxID=40520 RepID=UPI003565F096